MLTEEISQQIAFKLTQNSSRHAAFLRDAEIVYFSSAEDPVIALIQGVYDHNPQQARRILRSRIFSTTALDEASHGIVKVAAKRATGQMTRADRNLELPFRFRELKPDPPPRLLFESDLSPQCRDLLATARPMSAAFTLADEIHRREQRYDSDRKIAALLLDASGKFVAAAKNANAKNRTRHAEMNLLQGLLAEKGIPLPRGAQIYVTLKCCKMCAGMIAKAAEDIRTNHVYYGADDPGTMARATFLDRQSGLQSLLTGD